MLCEVQLLITIIFVSLLGIVSSESFLSKPSDPTYAFKGGSVFLNWSYTSTSSPWSKRWYQADAGGSPIGKLIMTQLGTQNPAVIKESFIGRVTYVENAGMLVTNVSLADAGSMKFDVTFVNHAALDNTIQLIVTIPPTIVTALANESIVFEKKESRHECVFDARPSPTIKWYLNNIEMNNIRYNINTTTIGYIGDTIRVRSILVINSSMPEDTGVISCIAILPNANISSATNHIVLYEPRETTFTSNNINHVGSLGQTATFTCSAHGNPSIFYQIYKDDSLLQNSTDGVYTLNSVSISDEGIYSCSPINIIGVGPLKKFNFTVHVAPALLRSSDSSTKTVLGSHLALSCIFYGEPTPNVTWRKHQSTIPNTANINTTVLSSNSSFTVVQSLLILGKVSKSDYGLYECMANNVAGFLAQNISVDVHYAPEFNVRLKRNYTLVEDFQKNGSWVCKADGNPEMSINWMINGKPAINGFSIIEKKNKKQSSNGFEIESTLTMVGINRVNAGSLICNVSNSIGNIQSHATIFIQYPPTAKTFLHGETNVTLNSTVNLVCDMNALPSPHIHWEKDGNILNSSHYMISEGVTYSSDLIVNVQKNLTIVNAKKSDFGTYRCVSVNKIGNLTQQTLLNILFKAEFMTSLVPVAYIQEGTRNHKLRCIVVGNPEPTISWIYNGTVVQNNSAVQIINRINRTAASTIVDSVLEFKVINKIYYGNYTCMASSGLGTVSSNQLLVVTYQPLILQSSANMVVTNASNTVTLFCEVQSNPLPTVFWKFQNQQVNRFVYTNQSYVLSKSLDKTSVRTELMIVNSTRFENGMYSCVANNSFGVVVHNTTLVVQYAPINITSLLAEYYREENTPFSMSCSFFSNPESTLFWKYNGSLIKDASSIFNESSFVHEKRIDRAITNSSIQVNALQRQMSGNYECFAENHQGLLGLKTTLIVDYEPTFKSQAASTVILDSKENTSLSCKVESSPLSTITWLKDGQQIQNNTKILITENLQYRDKFKAIVISKLQLFLADKSDTANYSCKATNKLGTKYQETRIIVQYSAEITTNFDSHQNLTESSTPLNFTCIVESHPSSTIQWFKDGSPYHHNVTTITVMSSDSKTVLQSKLSFPNGIKRKNFGLYSCRASNLLGNASRSTDVKVWYGPEFHSNLSGQVNLTKSGNASFECVVEANPFPTLEWHKNGIKITSNRYAIDTQTVQATVSKVILRSVINIRTVSKSDTAIYKCQTSNIVARKHQSIHLNVQYRPQLLVSSSNLTANKSNEVSLHCHVDANPTIVDYVWTKDGQRLNHNGQTYTIASAENLSTGIYKCTPINSIGSGETVTYGLLVRIPPTFTARADCKPNRVTNMMTCSCSGQGVPQPSVYWTKDSNITTIASGGNFQKSLFSKRIDGRYHCHLRNILGEVVSTSNFFYYITPTSDWQSWSKCNVTCGDGYQTRRRTCNIQICTEHLSETKNCTITCVPPAKQTDKPWAIALYVLIPVCFVLLVLLIVWLARTNRRKPRDDAVVIPVNGNLTKPPSVRSVPTRRDIYLPEKSFGSINPAYFVEENELQNQSMDITNTETKEMEIKFDKESLNESSTDKSDEQNQAEEEGLKQSPSLDTSKNEINSKSNENEEYQDADEVDTYLGPDGQTVSYSFYNELSTAL